MKALIFDFDGTILDTEYTEFLAWQEVYQQEGAELSLEYWLPAVGTNDGGFEPFYNLEQLLGKPLNRAQIERKVEVTKLRLNLALAPLPGVLEYLGAAPELGLRLGLASSSRLPWVKGHLERLGLWQKFEIVTTKENVERTKPDPALFVQAAKGLGVWPNECIIIEDSLNGVRAGKAAGAFTVAVPNRLTQHLDLSEADLVLPDLESLSLEQLLQAVR